MSGEGALIHRVYRLLDENFEKTAPSGLAWEPMWNATTRLLVKERDTGTMYAVDVHLLRDLKA